MLLPPDSGRHISHIHPIPSLYSMSAYQEIAKALTGHAFTKQLRTFAQDTMKRLGWETSQVTNLQTEVAWVNTPNKEREFEGSWVRAVYDSAFHVL